METLSNAKLLRVGVSGGKRVQRPAALCRVSQPLPVNAAIRALRRAATHAVRVKVDEALTKTSGSRPEVKYVLDANLVSRVLDCDERVLGALSAAEPQDVGIPKATPPSGTRWRGAVSVDRDWLVPG